MLTPLLLFQSAIVHFHYVEGRCQSWRSLADNRIEEKEVDEELSPLQYQFTWLHYITTNAAEAMRELDSLTLTLNAFSSSTSTE